VRRREDKFVRDFVASWHKVMNLDRFDRARSSDHRATRNGGAGAARPLPPRLVRPPQNSFHTAALEDPGEAR
jgi:hypothetical protein